jgi:hypothetical protein
LIALNLAFAYGALLDQNPRPLFPRRTVYAIGGSVLLYLPALATHCTRKGPLAWDGSLSFWVAALVSLMDESTIGILLYKAASRKDYPEVGDGL